MTFSLNKKSSDAQTAELASSLFRVVQHLLEGNALHSAEFDSDELTLFRSSIRDIAERFEHTSDPQDWLILAGEANKTIQTYNHLVEKFIRELSIEKQSAFEVLSHSLLKICHASESSARNLRQIEKELAKASQLPDLRELRAKLQECVTTLCAEAEFQEAQYRELKERISEASTLHEPRDQVTGLAIMTSAQSRIKEISGTGNTGYVVGFFLKNVDVVNRRFGFSAGDDVLRRFASYLTKSLQGKDQLYRWRGPCFVMVGDRLSPLDVILSEAYRVGARGPEVEVENDGNSMLLRLTAATVALPIPRGPNVSLGELSAKIDQFAAEQFKLAPAPK